jgi:hypothetical protein
MTRVVLDQSLLSMLPKSSGLVEICDAQGQIHGVFQALQPDEEISLEPEISNEELERRAKLPLHGRTLSEIMADLESRS